MVLWDELEAPDVEPNRYRLYCDECKRMTAFRYDSFGLPVCLEHQEEERS